ncbi:MAG: substrate-binding domain-containing protein [Acidobacteriota bacterium]|nr:substrate-binding domain-containing protein [Acidobacteriota bacterium]
MKALRLAICCCVMSAAATFLASCQEAYHQKEERYVFVTANVNLPYWQEAQAGFQDAAKMMGVKGEFTGPDSFSPEQELDALQKAIDSKPAGILVSASRVEMFRNAIDGAVGQGIPVICIDSDAPSSKRLMFIGTDNFRAGTESGKRMGEILKGQGRVVIVSIPGQFNLDERVRGVNDALKKFPGIKVVQTIDDKGDARSANDQISALLGAKNPQDKITGIICLEASGGSGAAEALHRLDQSGKIPIVAFDKDPETLDFVQQGVIAATIAQKPYVMSWYGVKFLDDLHHNAVHEFKDWRNAPAPPMPTFVDTGTAIIDKGNIAAFREALAAHPKPL